MLSMLWCGNSTFIWQCSQLYVCMLNSDYGTQLILHLLSTSELWCLKKRVLHRSMLIHFLHKRLSQLPTNSSRKAIKQLLTLHILQLPPPPLNLDFSSSTTAVSGLPWAGRRATLWRDGRCLTYFDSLCPRLGLRRDGAWFVVLKSNSHECFIGQLGPFL